MQKNKGLRMTSHILTMTHPQPCLCSFGEAEHTPHASLFPPRGGAELSHTSRKSSSSWGRTLPCRQRFRNHLSFMKSSRKLCLNCWDSWTSMFFSWLQNFCSSLLWRLRLCSSNSRLSSALCWSSFSCQDGSEHGKPPLIPDADHGQRGTAMASASLALPGLLPIAAHRTRGFLSMLGTEPRDSHIPGKCSATELHHDLCIFSPGRGCTDENKMWYKPTWTTFWLKLSASSFRSCRSWDSCSCKPRRLS